MLIIGHRGAAGIAPENTLEALQAGLEAGADILEFDVRLTKDKIPILAHDAKINGLRIGQNTLKKLRKAGRVTTLESVLDNFFGRILLNLEYKPVGNVRVVFEMISKKYIKKPEDWNNILFSSFHVSTLIKLRRISRKVNLALLHSAHPFSFLVYNRTLHLSAVGWHRLHYNKPAIKMAKKMDIFTYVYTVNRPQTAKLFNQRGVDGVVTDYPNKLVK